MKTYKIVKPMVALLVLIGIPVAHADQISATYKARAGDCLSGIVKAHYPDSTGHFFVLHWNPNIVDENRIEVGQAIILPGLSDDQILTEVDQAGCNAETFSVRNASKSAVTDKAHDVAEARVRLASTPIDPKPVVEKRRPTDTAFSKIPQVTAIENNVIASTISAQTEVNKVSANLTPAHPTPANPTPATRTKNSTRQSPLRQSSGTNAVPIDLSQRTMTLPGRGTRTVAAMSSKPRFAIDDELTMTSHSYRQSMPNRYVVNAIGARTLTAVNALVQHPDQHFYVESRAVWQDAIGGHGLKRSNTTSTPANNSVSTTTTPLETVLVQTEAPKTQSAGNIFIDESLLLKAAAQSGGNP
ncbi:MAG: hypothetical protein NXH95_14185 [Pseudomonadaceae bacterium]|nr:hypothetical protein [Pseudomonadaceae bacterium]